MAGARRTSVAPAGVLEGGAAAWTGWVAHNHVSDGAKALDGNGARAEASKVSILISHRAGDEFGQFFQVQDDDVLGGQRLCDLEIGERR